MEIILTVVTASAIGAVLGNVAAHLLFGSDD
jgi:hypothetical protein